jgi:hypothetical protein
MSFVHFTHSFSFSGYWQCPRCPHNRKRWRRLIELVMDETFKLRFRPGSGGKSLSPHILRFFLWNQGLGTDWIVRTPNYEEFWYETDPKSVTKEEAKEIFHMPKRFQDDEYLRRLNGRIQDEEMREVKEAWKKHPQLWLSADIEEWAHSENKNLKRSHFWKEDLHTPWPVRMQHYNEFLKIQAKTNFIMDAKAAEELEEMTNAELTILMDQWGLRPQALQWNDMIHQLLHCQREQIQKAWEEHPQLQQKQRTAELFRDMMLELASEPFYHWRFLAVI